MSLKFQIKERLRAGGIHLLLSLAVAAVVALLVFWLWFPGAYREFAGGTHLLLLVMAVDVTLGPLLTFAVFDRRKGRSHLRSDVATIALLQLAALSYGVYTVYWARPVALVFEQDRFRVIAAADVLQKELPQALSELRTLPLNGPRLIAVRKSTPGAERTHSLMTAVKDGVDTSQRPSFWIPYGPDERRAALQAARPVQVLLEQYPAERRSIRSALGAMGITHETTAWFLPVRARKDAVAVLYRDGMVAGFLMFDGYF